MNHVISTSFAAARDQACNDLLEIVRESFATAYSHLGCTIARMPSTQTPNETRLVRNEAGWILSLGPFHLGERLDCAHSTRNALSESDFSHTHSPTHISYEEIRE